MKIAHVLLLVAVVLLATIAAVSGAYLFLDRPLFAQATGEVEYLFTVEDIVGVDAQSDKLRMGAVGPGSRATRSMVVRYPSASDVHVRVRGPARGVLYPEQREYALVNGSANITFIAAPTNTTPHGTYEGVVKFYFT